MLTLFLLNNQLTEDHEKERRGTAKKIEVGEVIIVKPGPAEQPAHRGPREGEERHRKENRGRLSLLTLFLLNNQLTEDHEKERRGTAKKIEVGEVIIVKPGPAE